MGRELAISLYLFAFKVAFTIFKLFPQKKKATFVASFGDNVLFTLKELERQTDDEIVVLKTSQCTTSFKSKENRLIIDFKPTNLIAYLQSIYHLSTSDKVFVDNYYGFLAVTNFRPNTKCIQLWHAAGAIKQFGLKDPSNKKRSSRALSRFNSVYQRFDHVVVGSEKMVAIFQKSFGLPEEKMLRTGIPRTDYLFCGTAKEHAETSFKLDYPAINNKKVILYAPTYRDNEINIHKLKLNLDKMYNKLKYSHVLLLRLHPIVNGEFENKYPGFVYNVSSYPDINHLLVLTDILISDYSSIPFEFALLEKPMIFYAYDAEEYEQTSGFWEDYEKLAPGPIVHDTSEVIDVLQENEFDLDIVRKFSREWNEYSNGESSANLISALYENTKRDQ